MNGDDEWAGTPFPYRVIICGVFIVAFVYLIMMPFYLYKGRLISEETITADVTIVDGTKHVKTPITMPYEIDIKYGSQYISYYTIVWLCIILANISRFIEGLAENRGQHCCPLW